LKPVEIIRLDLSSKLQKEIGAFDKSPPYL